MMTKSAKQRRDHLVRTLRRRGYSLYRKNSYRVYDRNGRCLGRKLDLTDLAQLVEQS
jgi:predicted DCC family thiol-disulfide oxidoreductase YuxK